jgi:hypothetical protein
LEDFVTAQFTVQLTDPTHEAAGLETSILANFSEAAGDWLSHFADNGSIDFQIVIAPTAAGRSESAPASLVWAGDDHGVPLYQASTLHELATGIDANGAVPDAVITIDPSYLHHDLWIDPSPVSETSPVPSDKVDLASIFRHEIGHDLGIIGATPAGGWSPGWETTFDAQTVATDGGVFFVGAHARAVYGGDVPITTLANGEAHSHLGNTLAEPAGRDLMNGVAFYFGTRYEVTPLDLAILEDIGAPLVAPAVATAGAVIGAADPPPAATESGQGGWTGHYWEQGDHHHSGRAAHADADYHHYWG